MNIKSNTPDRSDMNELDNEFFDTYIEGDSPLSEIYKRIDCAEPSNKLNQTILSAARASTEHASDSKSRWTQIRSWAASVAILSLAGILAHNTWQAEQDAVHQEISSERQEERLVFPLQQNSSQQGRLARPEAASRLEKAATEAGIQVEQESQTPDRAKKNISRNNSKDTRQLLYKSPPVPVMQSTPAYFKSNRAEPLLKESDIQQFEDSHELISNIYKEKKPSPEFKTKKRPLSEQQIELNKITQLIENNKINQAQELLLQFKTKYPDYPIDPVILKHLSPY